MTNLFNRLKPEVLELLLIEQLAFPSTINQLLKQLESNNSWLDLTYGNICTLKVHLDLKDYSPDSIDKLFN